jgi:hypothetical protein
MFLFGPTLQSHIDMTNKEKHIDLTSKLRKKERISLEDFKWVMNYRRALSSRQTKRAFNIYTNIGYHRAPGGMTQ